MIYVQRAYISTSAKGEVDLEGCFGCGWYRFVVWSTRTGEGMNLFYWPSLTSMEVSRSQWRRINPAAPEILNIDKMRAQIIDRRDNYLALSVQFDREKTEEVLDQLQLAALAATNTARPRVRTRPTPSAA